MRKAITKKDATSRFRLLENNDVAKLEAVKSDKWPLACVSCKGTGDTPLTEADLDVDFSNDRNDYFCKQCLVKGKCPRCHKPVPAGWRSIIESGDEYLTCKSCGWKEGDKAVL